MAQGGPEAVEPRRESAWLILPPAALLVLALALGVHLAAPLRQSLADAAGTLGGSAP